MLTGVCVQVCVFDNGVVVDLSSSPCPSLPSLLASLILKLRGEDAIQAVNVIIRCVSSGSGGAMVDQVEDGEISVELTARQLLLEAARLVLVSVFGVLSKFFTKNC